MSNQTLIRNLSELNDEQYDRSLSSEAQRVVKEISFGVELANVSNVLENSETLAYINIRTLEKENWCVELTSTGYMIVSDQFDTIDDNIRDKNLCQINKYETIEALMHQISSLFVKKFNNSVAEKLKLIS